MATSPLAVGLAPYLAVNGGGNDIVVHSEIGMLFWRTMPSSRPGHLVSTGRASAPWALASSTASWLVNVALPVSRGPAKWAAGGPPVSPLSGSTYT